MLLVEIVDSLLGLLDDSVLWLVMLVWLELLSVDEDDVLSELVDNELVDRVLVDSVLVLELLTDEVLLVESDERLLVDSELVERLLALDVLRLLVLRLDALEALDSLISSTLTIRRSCAISAPCCWLLNTIALIASLVGKSRIAGARVTPPPVSRRIARQSRSFSSVTDANSIVLASAWVVR